MPTIRRQYEKLERNSICPCDDNMKLKAGDEYNKGDRKKYKKCCLQKMVLQEQKARMMVNDRKEIAGVRRHVAAAIQHDIDHPIILPDDNLCVPGNSGSNIIIP